MKLTFIPPRLRGEEGTWLLNGVPLGEILERPADYSPLYCQAALAIVSLHIQPLAQKLDYLRLHPDTLSEWGVELAS